MWNLFLDDLRSPNEIVNPLGIKHWVIARSVSEAKRLVEVRRAPSVISFDHDLGPEEDNNGYAFAKWLVEKDLEYLETYKDFLPTHFQFQIHSANLIGAKNIEGLLNNWLSYKKIITTEELVTLKELLKETT